MLNRRDLLAHSAKVATLLATTGLLPQFAHAAYNAAAFEVSVIKNRHGALGTSPLVLAASSGCIRDPGVFGR